MPLVPDPCFIETIRRASGPQRVLVHVANANPRSIAYKITAVTKPDWIDVEHLMIGRLLECRNGGKVPVIVNINTDHRFFPTDPSVKDEIRFEFEDADPLTIYVYLKEVIAEVPVFRGTFSIDFGTTNSCYAWKRRVGDDVQVSDMFKPPEASREIPTLIRFKDISNGSHPVVEIGNHARHYIAHNSGKNFTYQISIKRLLGLEKEIVTLDERSGMMADRFQNYRAEDIAGFYLRDLLRDAERQVGERIETIVATFPILFTKAKQEALRKSFANAFKGLNRPWDDGQLILRLDETNAAAFNYIYGQLLDEFRRFSVQEKKHRLLSYDMGGGTIDVSLVDVDLSRDEAGRIRVHTEVRGVTGERYFAGDNITLATVRILKLRLAVLGAKKRLEIIEAERAAAAEAANEKAKADNPWTLPTMDDKPQASSDPWAEVTAEAQARDEAEAIKPDEPEDPETADIQNLTPDTIYAQAVETVIANEATIEVAASTGKSFVQAVEHLVAQGQLKLQTFEIKEKAQEIEDAVDTVLPTRWTVLERRGDLIAKDTARKLFYELWLPAEVLKIRCVTEEGKADLTEPLNKIAKYVGVRPEHLLGVTIREDEINRSVEEPLRRSIRKSAYLRDSVADHGVQASGLNFNIGALGQPEERPFTVLLAGNSSRLPAVRSTILDVFKVDEDQVVMDPNGVKAITAQGACEEHILKRDFGSEGGLIQYTTTDLTTTLPFSIGLFHRELSLIGFAGGFAPVLARGTQVGAFTVLTESLQVVHKEATELTLFAYYHDHELGNDPTAEKAIPGVEPTNIGWFDLTKTEDTPWEGELPEDIAAQVEANGEIFQLVLHMDENRDLTLIDPASKARYCMRPAAELCPESENPFSGIH